MIIQLSLSKWVLLIFCFATKIVYSQTVTKVKLNDEVSTLNIELPKDYTERTFLKGLSMYRNKIEELVGCLIIVEDNKKVSIIEQILESNQPSIKSSILSDVLYSSKISSGASFNGSYMIASLSTGSENILELIITDICGILIPERYVPYLEICKAAKKCGFF